MLVHVGSQDSGLGTPSAYPAKTISWNACKLLLLFDQLEHTCLSRGATSSFSPSLLSSLSSAARVEGGSMTYSDPTPAGDPPVALISMAAFSAAAVWSWATAATYSCRQGWPSERQTCRPKGRLADQKADLQTERQTDTGTDTVIDTGMNTDTDTDSDADTGMPTDTDTGTDTDADTGSDIGHWH